MLSKLKRYILIICIFIIISGLSNASNSESVESEEIPAVEDEVGGFDASLVSQKEFRKVMSSSNSTEEGPEDLKTSDSSKDKSDESKKDEKVSSEKDEDKKVGSETTDQKDRGTSSSEGEAKDVSKKAGSDDSKTEEKQTGAKPDEVKPEEVKSENPSASQKVDEEEKGSLKEEVSDNTKDDSKVDHDKPAEPDSEEKDDSSASNASSGEETKKNDESKENIDVASSEVAGEDDLGSESSNNSDEQGNNNDEANKDEHKLDDQKNDSETSSSKDSEKSKTNENLEGKEEESPVVEETNGEGNKPLPEDTPDTPLESDVEKTIQEMKNKLGVGSTDEAIKRVDDKFIVIVKMLKSPGKNEDIPTETKNVDVNKHEDQHNQSSDEKTNENTTEKESKSDDSTQESKTEESDSNNEKTNMELIEKLKSLSEDNSRENEEAKEKIKTFNNLLDAVENKDEKEERLIKEKKEYDEKKSKKEKLPLQKRMKWYEKRDPVTGELLFDAAALSRNITSTISAKRRKGVFSKCVEYHGQKENCESNKNCFYDSIYEMCLFNCSLLNKRDSCEEYLECRFDFIVPRKACVNDCFQSRDFTKQELNGIMRGCMWCTQELMCNTLSNLQRKKFPDSNYREFDCNWQVQNGLENNTDENVENSICVDRNLGRTMTDKDLIAANYITTQAKLVHEAAEKIKIQMVKSGESEENAKLQVQNINILKMNICYPPNIPFSSLKPEKKYYLNEEVVEIYCEDGYKVTGASNQLRCENGIFSPKVYCIAQKEIEKQKRSISKHFNNIINLLVNSITGGGGWIDVGIESITQKKGEESDLETGEKSGEEISNKNLSKSEEEKSSTEVTPENESAKLEDKLKLKESNDTEGFSEKGSETVTNSDLEYKAKEQASAESGAEAETSGSTPQDIEPKKIILDRVTGTPIFVQETGQSS
ncbi:sushi domain-containing protein [Cryptosporidium felis]|nr:sushi domain-containing protein [Cryptosporidium felis]